MNLPDEKLAQLLWALGDAVRIQIIRLLPTSAECEKARNVSEIAEQLGLSQPTISHHLRILRQCGILQQHKQCRDVYYWINPEAICELLCAVKALFPCSQQKNE
jgi:ArsR family transcriptional regulator